MRKIKKIKKISSKRGSGKNAAKVKNRKPLKIKIVQKKKNILAEKAAAITSPLIKSDFFIAPEQKESSLPAVLAKPDVKKEVITALKVSPSKISNAKISRYVLDLKKIQSENEIQKQLIKERGNYIGEEIVNALQNKKTIFINNLKDAYQRIRPKSKPQYKIKTSIFNKPNQHADTSEKEMPARQFTWPKFKLPTFSLPQFN